MQPCCDSGLEGKAQGGTRHTWGGSCSPHPEPQQDPQPSGAAPPSAWLLGDRDMNLAPCLVQPLRVVLAQPEPGSKQSHSQPPALPTAVPRGSPAVGGGGAGGSRPKPSSFGVSLPPAKTSQRGSPPVGSAPGVGGGSLWDAERASLEQGGGDMHRPPPIPQPMHAPMCHAATSSPRKTRSRDAGDPISGRPGPVCGTGPTRVGGGDGHEEMGLSPSPVLRQQKKWKKGRDGQTAARGGGWEGREAGMREAVARPNPPW